MTPLRHVYTLDIVHEMGETPRGRRVLLRDVSTTALGSTRPPRVGSVALEAGAL